MINFKKPVDAIEKAVSKAGSTVTTIAIIAGVAVVLAVVALAIAVMR